MGLEDFWGRLEDGVVVTFVVVGQVIFFLEEVELDEENCCWRS